MNFLPHQYYHVYNQGNNQQQLFFDSDNYAYFISLMQRFIVPNCHLISWCLMPNHFHFLILTNETSIQTKQVGSLQLTLLSNGIRMLQSSYTAAINKRRKETGSKFRQKAKAKFINKHTDEKYLLTCFRYIHQNPLKANLVSTIEAWPFSSFHEYVGASRVNLCQKQFAAEFLNVENENFYIDSGNLLDQDLSPLWEL